MSQTLGHTDSYQQLGHGNAVEKTWGNSSELPLKSHYDTLKLDEALKLSFLQAIHNFAIKFLVHYGLHTCTPAHAGCQCYRDREETHISLPTAFSIHECSPFLAFCIVIRERKQACLLLNKQRKQHEEAVRAATSTREGELELLVTTTQAGAVPSLTKDSVPATQTGKEEQVQWQKPGSDTVCNHHKSPRVMKQGCSLARKASQQVRIGDGQSQAQADLQHSSKMQRLSLNTATEQEEATQARRPVTALPQPLHGCFNSILIQGRSSTWKSWPWMWTVQVLFGVGMQSSDMGHNALVPENTITLCLLWGKRSILLYTEEKLMKKFNFYFSGRKTVTSLS